jgi:predicted CxxxxCH...CXXCH cytochrome family protein
MDRDSISTFGLRSPRCTSVACHPLTKGGELRDAPTAVAWGPASLPTLLHSQTDLMPNLRIAHGDEFILPLLGSFLFAEPISVLKMEGE